MVRAQQAKFAKRVKTDTDALTELIFDPALKGARMPQERSKYRNVKCVVNGEKFDSQREAAYWQGLVARERAGEITDLRRQVAYPLLAPTREAGSAAVVAHYIADFVFVQDGVQRVLDAKGLKTQMYLLKRKWLELQDGIKIEEV